MQHGKKTTCQTLGSMIKGLAVPEKWFLVTREREQAKMCQGEETPRDRWLAQV